MTKQTYNVCHVLTWSSLTMQVSLRKKLILFFSFIMQYIDMTTSKQKQYKYSTITKMLNIMNFNIQMK